jgi:glutathione S-transferase
MLTLYYSPGACSLASHIALLENNIPCQLKKVDLKTHTTEDGQDYYSLSQGKGYVPAITLDNGETLMENSAVLFYISEAGANSSAAAIKSGFGRYRLQEGLAFVSSELHKTLGAYFNPKLPDAYKEIARAKLTRAFNVLETKLMRQAYLAGNDFTPADAYCFTILRWLPHLNTGLNLADWPTLNAYFDRIAQRPKVIEALQAEGLLA